MKKDTDYQNQRFLTYAQALGISNDPIALSFWAPIVNKIIRLADSEIVKHLSDHAESHNYLMEQNRHELVRLENLLRDHGVEVGQTPHMEEPDRTTV